jgi:hypothetical protein
VLVFDENFKVRDAVGLFAAQRGDQPVNVCFASERFKYGHISSSAKLTDLDK